MFDNIRDLTKTASEVKKFEPDVIIDDYIQLVTPTGKNPKGGCSLKEYVMNING